MSCHGSSCEHAPTPDCDNELVKDFDPSKIETQIFQQVAASAQDLVLSHLDAIPVPSGKGLFTFADFGSSDGSSTLPLVNKMIKRLRDRYGDQLGVQIIYEDTEHFDFNRLFKTLQDGDTYMKKFGNVYPMATNIRFDNQCVPSNSCDIIYSSFGKYFVNNCPVNFTDSMYHFTSANPAELLPFYQAAEKDWEDYLLLRAEELKPGGVLVLLNPCGKVGTDPVTGKQGLENSSQADPYTDFEKAWTHLKDSNVITEEEWKACSTPEIYRTKRQTTAPMEQVTSPVHQAGLRVLHYDEILIPCGIKTMWREKGTGASREEFADLQTAYHRGAWANDCFHYHLAKSRSEDEKSVILKQLFAHFRQIVLDRDPETYRSECLVSRLLVQKIVK